jgi:hypothetical protein
MENRIAYVALSGLVLLSAWTLPAGSVLATKGRAVEIVADKDNIFRIPGHKHPVITAKRGALSQIQVVEICDAVEKGDLPPASSMLLNPRARLSTAAVYTICGRSRRV